MFERPGPPFASLLASVVAAIGALVGCNAVFGIHEGTPRPICADTSPSEPLIDDMEDGDGFICPLAGRNGHWYTDRGALEPTPIPGKRGTSQFAARFTGTGSTTSGSLMGFALNVVGTGTIPVDVHTVAGLIFWMTSSVPVTVNFRTPQTISPTDGGACVDRDTVVNCNNDFAFLITAPSSDWKEYRVPFDALRQLQHGGSATWNPRFLDSIQFNVGPGVPFDVWVDDIRFYYSCAETVCLPTCTPDRPVACPATDDRPAGCMPPATDCAAVATWCADPLLIDDMEDGDRWICDTGGRYGGWSTNGYERGAASPVPGPDLEFEPTMIPGGRGASRYAAHITGTGIQGLARMGFQLNALPAGEADYDGSKYDGVRFALKSDVPVIVGFTSPETLPMSENGTCDASTARENCDYHFEFVTTATGNEWLDYKVPFSALRRVAPRDAPAHAAPPNATWDASHLRSIAFLSASPDFDVWIDDLAFYTCGTELCAPTCAGATPVSCAAAAGRPAGCWPAGTDCASAIEPAP